MSKENPVYFSRGGGALSQDALQRITDRVFTILDSIYDGVYITDGQAVTIMVNHAYLTISGLEAEQVLGKDMWQLVSSGVINRSGTLCALKAKASVTLEQSFRTGKQVLITSTPCFDDDGEISMVITVVRDMTELYDLQAKHRESEARYRRELNHRFALLSGAFIAADPRTIEVLKRAEKVAALNTTVLLLGETGAGKEQFARFIYENSARADQSFIGINCGAIPPTLIESELFGYERGAFTGASREGKMGIFEGANHGTVFLDEIGDLPLEMQVHLLRVLQDMQVKRIGSVRSIPIDVRIITATNRDLKEMVHAKTFREDLYYRLNVVPIVIPPLRERGGDIVPLVHSFLTDMNKKYSLQKIFTSDAMQVMCTYGWPGNVRELKNVVEQAVILSVQDYILPSDLPITGTGEAPGASELDLRYAVAQFECGYIDRAYQRYGNVRDAAASLGLEPSTYVRKRKRLQTMLHK